MEVTGFSAFVRGMRFPLRFSLKDLVDAWTQVSPSLSALNYSFHGGVCVYSSPSLMGIESFGLLVGLCQSFTRGLYGHRINVFMSVLHFEGRVIFGECV